jgi:hypothetical protein
MSRKLWRDTCWVEEIQKARPAGAKENKEGGGGGGTENGDVDGDGD